ncbi:MAG: Uma2 family endonuclease [Planctomycetota bacterium]
MSQARVAYRWKTSDLDRLPDEPLLRYEIIDGELIVSRRPHLEHSEIIMTLGSFIRPVVRPLGGKVLAEPGIVWGEEAEDNVVPDVAIVLPDRLHLAKGRALSGTPNIAIEVVSESSLSADYVQKRYLYERTGTQEYWIVDRFECQVQVWQFAGEHATSISYGNNDTLTTPLLPDLSIPVRDIWP